MSVVERVKELCKEKKIPISRLERDLGFGNGYIGQLKKGVLPNDRLDAIASYLEVSPAYLASDAASAMGDSMVFNPDGSVTIKVYGTIPAGIPMEAIEDVIDSEQIPFEMTRGGREYFALQVKGDSMYPIYMDGDTIIVRKASSCQSGDDCIVYVNGDDATLKRVFLYDDGRLEIRPVNPNYAPRIFSAQEVDEIPVSIGGVVVELRRKMK